MLDILSDPEILRIPADGLVLQMKNMNIDLVTNFPFPTPPDSASLKVGCRAFPCLPHSPAPTVLHLFFNQLSTGG